MLGQVAGGRDCGNTTFLKNPGIALRVNVDVGVSVDGGELDGMRGELRQNGGGSGGQQESVRSDCIVVLLKGLLS